MIGREDVHKPMHFNYLQLVRWLCFQLSGCQFAGNQFSLLTFFWGKIICVVFVTKLLKITSLKCRNHTTKRKNQTANHRLAGRAFQIWMTQIKASEQADSVSGQKIILSLSPIVFADLPLYGTCVLTEEALHPPRSTFRRQHYLKARSTQCPQ